MHQAWFPPLAAAFALWTATSTVAAQGNPQRPFPQHETYAAGTLRLSHISQAQQDQDVRDAFDAWATRYVKLAGREADGHVRLRIDNGSGDTVSEGQGYGMLLAVYMAGHEPRARMLFDGLWEFRLDHASTIDPRLMDWFVKGDESPDSNGDDSAFDGDADMAYALLLAARQWGRDGRFDYLIEARKVINGLRDAALGPQSHLPMLGDWVSPNGTPYSQWTPRSSDLLLNHFDIFALASGDSIWSQSSSDCMTLIDQMQMQFAPNTGLLPDFMIPAGAPGLPLKPAGPNFLEGPNDGAFGYNACRNPWRLGTYALTTGNTTVMTQTQNMATWIALASGGNPQNIRAGYALNGTPLPGSNYFTSVFAAPFGVAAMTEPGQQAFLNDTYDSVKNRREGYYEDSVSLLCMLVMTGNWWTP